VKAGLDVIQGTRDNLEVATDVIMQKGIGDAIPVDSVSHTAPLGKGKLFEYFVGCEADNVCANSRDIQLTTDMNIIGDDVCIPNEVFPKYVWNKMITYQAQRTPNQPNLGQAHGIGTVPVAAGTNVSKALLDGGLADMCFRQIPYASTVEMAYAGSTIASFWETHIEQRLPRTLAGLFPFPALSEFRRLGGVYGWLGSLSEEKELTLYPNSYPGRLLAKFLGLQTVIPTFYGLIREHFIGGVASQWLIDHCDGGPGSMLSHCVATRDWKANNKTASDVINAIPYTNFEAYAGVPPNSQAKIAEMQRQLGRCLDCARNSEISTALGCVPVDNIGRFITEVFFGILLGIAGSYCVLCVAVGAVRLQTSQGNSTEIEKVRKQIMQCLLGLLLVIFAVLLFKLIGMSLRIPGIN
jgi:hypothetical protein